MEFFNLSKKRFMYTQDHVLSRIAEYSEMGIYSFIAFVIPMLLKHPQFLIGSAVNCALVLAAFNLKGYKSLPIILLPSVAVLLNGLIFGPFSIFLLYMMPFIWMSNAVVVFLTKYLTFEKDQNKFIALGISIAAKVALLFTAAFILVKLTVIPSVFLTAMGVIQIYTAVSGAVAAIAIQKVKNVIYLRNREQ